MAMCPVGMRRLRHGGSVVLRCGMPRSLKPGIGLVLVLVLIWFEAAEREGSRCPEVSWRKGPSAVWRWGSLCVGGGWGLGVLAPLQPHKLSLYGWCCDTGRNQR